MAFVEWKNAFSVGVLEIDDQHRKLLAIINHLHDAMRAGSDTAELSRVMDELVNYTRFHFAFEEQLMERVAYPDVQEHRRRHQAMVARVVQFQADVANARALFSMKLMEFLKYWLSKHILETDMAYALFIAGQVEGAQEARRRKAS
jgi:hemerythrin